MELNGGSVCFAASAAAARRAAESDVTDYGAYNRRRLRPSAVSSVLDFPPHLQPKRVSLGHERRDFNENIPALISNYEIECESIEILEFYDLNTPYL